VLGSSYHLGILKNKLIYGGFSEYDLIQQSFIKLHNAGYQKARSTYDRLRQDLIGSKIGKKLKKPTI
jgi:hypothetical protein